MDNFLLLVLMFGGVLLGNCNASINGNYATVIPSILRPGRPLDISVQILSTTDTVTVTASVIDIYKTTIATKTKDIQKQGMLSLDIPVTATSSSYTVKVSGQSSVNNFRFSNETKIKTDLKTMSVMIQTDKGFYKPGKTVKFRVLAVDSRLLPYSGTFDVLIKDPNKSIIKQLKGVKGTSGIYANQLQLSEEPVLGEWTIHATPQTGKKDEKTVIFTVAEYVLPKFEVQLNLPSYILPETENLVITVIAKYTYGKNVKGSGNIYLKLKGSSYEKTQYKYPELKRSVTLLNGKVDATFSRKDLISLAGTKVCISAACFADNPAVAEYSRIQYLLMNRIIEVSSTIKEELTGKEITSDGTVQVISNPFEATFLKFSPSTFKAGLKWKGVVQLKKKDGSNPATSDLKDHSGNPIPLYFTATCSTYRPKYNYRSVMMEQNYIIDTTGLVEVSFSAPSNATSCSLQARFKVATATKYVEKFLSKSEESVQLNAIGFTGAIPVGQYVAFELYYTQKIPGFFYQMLSKGHIIKQEYVTAMYDNSTIFSLLFDDVLCRQAAPNARIIAWYMSTTGEIIADSIDFSVKGAFANKVSLQFSTDQTKPGSSVSLTVKSHPMSVVGLLAVDQSVSLMGGGNDITQSEVMSELRSYDSSDAVSSNGMYDFYWWPVYSGGKDTLELLKNAGVQVLTDGFIYEENSYIFNRGEAVDAIAPPAVQGPAAPTATVRAATTTIPGRPGIVEEDAKVNTPLVEPTRIRREFPETWIWMEEVSDNSGNIQIKDQVPDTITSWVASAFALHNEAGLGIAEQTAKITVLKPFFVSLNLPYSMIRGEEVALQATVFNYLQQDIEVVVTLEASKMFKVRHSNGNNFSADKDVQTSIMVPSGDGALVSFWVVPTVLGQVPLSVKARSAVAADAVQRNILVEPEGELKEQSHTSLINLDPNQNPYKETLTVEYPKNGVVPGSQRVVFTAIGDLMGPSISGLDKLLRMPYGCGEQNMVKFAPNIYVLKYLTSTKQLTADIENKAMNYLESGYQRELNYQRSDGSFSAFGNRDKAGSMWLTAFVIRCFHQARAYITIDQDVIDKAALWIVDHQNTTTGAFSEPKYGRVLHAALQGGSAKGISSSAYVLATLLENKDKIASLTIKSKVTTSITKAITHVESQLESIKDDPYALSLVTYALKLAEQVLGENRPLSNVALGYLNGFVKTEGTMKYWAKDEKDDETRPEPVPYWLKYRLAPSYNIEMTAYGLLIYTLTSDEVDGMAVASYLSTQRNSLGGYRSTQDTVIALHALSTFQELVGTKSYQDLNVNLTVDGRAYEFDTISTKNNMVLQSVEISGEINKVEITGSGNGIALVQMNIFCNILNKELMGGIELTVTSDVSETGEVLVNACGRWVNEGPSGMVVLQLNALTGYDVGTDDILSTYEQYGVKRIEKDGKALYIYFDEFTQDAICITVKSVNVEPVANIQEAMARAYNYYKPELQDTSFYIPNALKQTTVCSSCPACCQDILPPRPTDNNCVNNPCQNGGSCIDDIGGIYQCRCAKGFTGDICSIKEPGEVSGSNVLATVFTAYIVIAGWILHMLFK